jgi:hypothetical protein
LRIRPEAAERMTWSSDRDPLAWRCSLCGRSIDEREAPLRIMGKRCAVLCDQCVAIAVVRI